MAANKYDANSISILEGLEAVRMRPGMYIGSVGTKGLNHLIYEIADNSVDEHLAGFCTQINVTLNDEFMEKPNHFSVNYVHVKELHMDSALNQAENTDRSRFQRKEVGIRTDEQDIEEEGQHRLLPYQHQYIVRTMQ